MAATAGPLGLFGPAPDHSALTWAAVDYGDAVVLTDPDGLGDVAHRQDQGRATALNVGRIGRRAVCEATGFRFGRPVAVAERQVAFLLLGGVQPQYRV